MRLKKTIALVLTLAATRTISAAEAPSFAGLESLPIASRTDEPLDQDLFLVGTPLPPPCREDNGKVTLCGSDLALTFPRARYAELKRQWGERKPAPARLLEIVQLSREEWVLQFAPDGADHPLSWFEPSARGLVLRLWPVVPTVGELQSNTETEAATWSAVGMDSLRIELPLPPSGPLRWLVAWEGSLLRIRLVSPSTPRKVLIDAGHGGGESGTNGGPSPEKTLNLQAAEALAGALRARKVDVHLTRDADRELPLAERARQVSAGEFDLALSLHHDWYQGTIFGRKPACLYHRADLLPLARQLCAILSDEGKAPVAPAQRALLFLLPYQTPAILLELLDTKNPEQRKLASDPKRYARFLKSWAEKTARRIVASLSQSPRVSK